MPVHPFAVASFTQAADAYRRARPTYPDPAIDWLADALDLRPGRSVLDVGAGTGKFTVGLVRTGASIIAVEPVAAMRAAFTTTLPGIPVVEGTAEALPFADASVDAIVAAQAFHWFDPARTLAEFHRVLRPTGRIGLIWNVRDTEVPWVAELERLLDAHAGGAPYHEDWRGVIESDPHVGPLTAAEFASSQTLDAEGLRDRLMSISFIAALPQAVQQEFLADVGRLIAAHPDTAGHPTIELPYRTRAYWTERRD
jgi:SAM-dependent methyltransferase